MRIAEARVRRDVRVNLRGLLEVGSLHAVNRTSISRRRSIIDGDIVGYLGIRGRIG